MKAQDASCNPSVKLSFLGGCHVLGFLVGRENSFVSICSTKLHAEGLYNQADVFPYMNLKRAKDAVAICNAAKPDVLVLQCHYLFNPNLNKRIKNFFRRPKKKVAKPYNLNAFYSDYRVADTDASFNATWKVWLKIYAMHCFHSVLGYTFISKSKSLSYIDVFFDAVKKTGVEKVIVLSPFPCTDIVLNKYRKMGGALLQEKSLAYGFDYVDVFPVIENKYPHSIFTIDDVHLNKEAHRFLGEYLAVYLSKQLLHHQQQVMHLAS